MSSWVVFAASLISLAGLGYLASTDPKRRRTHGLAKLKKRTFLWPARLATFGPGLYLAVIGHWAGLSIWAGTATTLGWVIAAITPQAYARLQADLRAQREGGRTKARELLERLSSVSIRYAPERLRMWRSFLPHLNKKPKGRSLPGEVEALKDRIAALEARIARLETGAPDENNSSEQRGTSRPGEAISSINPLDAAG